MVKHDFLVDFRHVYVGTVSKKTLLLSEISGNFSLERYILYTHQNVSQFSVRKCASKDKYGRGSGTFNSVEVMLRPTIFNQHVIDFFKIILEDGSFKILCCKATCMGSSVNVTTNFIRFNQKPGMKGHDATFEMINSSNISVAYDFIHDSRNSAFKIESGKCGTIGPKGHFFVKIRFSAEKVGSYYLLLNCVFQYQEPIMIELNGVKFDGSLPTKRVHLDNKKALIYSELGYWESYMEGETPPHIFKDRIGQEVCSLTHHQLYFTLRSNLQISTLENLTSDCLALTWDKPLGEGSENIFLVKPLQELLFPGQKLDIICRMNTRQNDFGSFYSTLIYGRLFPFSERRQGLEILNGNTSGFPWTFTISLVGHTFPGDFAWIPSVRILPSNTIIVPTATPFKSVYNTFMIKISGELPVLFRFRPPEKTSVFALKPMQGVISIPNGFKIIVVKCFPSISNGVIEERWTLELNGNSSNDMDIIFKAAVETPNVVVEENNVVDYGAVYPGATKTKKIKITNNTGHNFNFDFKKDRSVWIEPNRGCLHGCQAIHVTMFLKADYDFPESYFYTGYFFYVERLHMQSGIPYEVTIEVLCRISYSALCALPSEFDFREIVCSTTHSTNFSIFNFGESFLCFRLKYIKDEQSSGTLASFMESKRLYSSKNMLHLCSSENHHKRLTFESLLDTPYIGGEIVDYKNLVVHSEKISDVVKIEPNKGQLNPGENMEVKLSVIAYNRGLIKGCIVYEILVNEMSDEVVNNQDPIWPDSMPIFKMTYLGLYPTLQFIDIAENTCGPLFGFVKIWEMMKIDKLNKILMKIERNETYQHYVRIPDAEFGANIKKDIVFIVENITNIETSWDVTQQKICDCGYKIVQTSLTRRAKIFDCPHKNLINLEISNKIVLPSSLEFFAIRVSYDLEGDQTACFQLSLSQNRTITLYFKLRGLISGQGGLGLSPFTWNYTYKMKYIYIGLMESFLQTYWFYNNTRTPYSYQLDDSALEEINKKYGCAILKCINPVGTVEPKSYGHIYFLFHPIDLNLFDIELPIEYCNITKPLRLIAQGEMQYHSPMSFIVGSTFGIKDYYHPGLLLSLSVDTIAVGPLLTYTRSSAMFFFQNVDKEDTLAFAFKDQDMPGILSLTVTPNKGLVKPKEIVACVLKIKTFGKSVAIRNQLPLFYVNYTKLKEHMTAKENFHKRGMEMQHEFMLGDSGKIEYPHQVPDEIIRTPPKILTTILSITVCINSVVDRDIKQTLEEQQTQIPYREISVYRRCLYESLIPTPGYMDEPLKPSHMSNEAKLYSGKFKKDKTPNKKICEACQHDRCEPNLNEMDPETFIVIHTVVENLLHDALHSKMFKDLLRRAITEMPPLYYGHFKHFRHGGYRKKLVRNILNPPPKWLLSSVIEQMTQEVVVSMFNMKKGKSCVTSTMDYDGSLMNLPSENSFSGGKVDSHIGKRKELLEENYNHQFLYTNMFLFLLDYL